MKNVRSGFDLHRFPWRTYSCRGWFFKLSVWCQLVHTNPKNPTISSPKPVWVGSSTPPWELTLRMSLKTYHGTIQRKRLITFTKRNPGVIKTSLIKYASNLVLDGIVNRSKCDHDEVIPLLLERKGCPPHYNHSTLLHWQASRWPYVTCREVRARQSLTRNASAVLMFSVLL